MHIKLLLFTDLGVLMSIDSDLIRGHVDTIILKTLATGDKYGYEIIKEIENKSKGTYELKQPTLYSCLKRLEGQGFISAYWVNSEIGGRRHYYKLTDLGRQEYTNNMNEWLSSRSIIDDLISNEIPAYEDKDYTLSSPNKTSESVENTEAISNIAPKNDSENSEITQPNFTPQENFNTNVLQDYYQNASKIEDEQDKNPTNSNIENTESRKLDGIKIGEVQSAKTKFNIKDYKSNGTTFFNSVKDFESLDENEEVSPTPQKPTNYFSANTFDNILNTTDENSNNYFENNVSDNNYTDYSGTNTSNESLESEFSTYKTLDENHEESSNITDLNYWNKGFSLKNNDEEDNFRYDYDRDPEFSDSTELAIKDEYDSPILRDNYDSPSIKEDYPEPTSYQDAQYSSFNENYSDEDYYNPYGKDENATASLFVDNKRTFTPQYTDNESKTLLNTLSSYGSTNFEATSPREKLQESTSSYETLENNLGKKGIMVTEYVRRPKEPVVLKNYIWCNKIKCVTSWIAYAITLALLITSFLIANSFDFVDWSKISSTLPAGFYLGEFITALTIVPIVFTIMYFLNKTKKVKAKFNFKVAIIFSLLFFIQALIIIYAVNIPFGLYSFTQKDYVHYRWLLPAVCVCYLPIHTLIYEVLYKSKKFHA